MKRKFWSAAINTIGKQIENGFEGCQIKLKLPSNKKNKQYTKITC